MDGGSCEKRKLWFSSDFLPADEKMDDDLENNIKRLRERVRGVKDEVRVAVALKSFNRRRFATFSQINRTASWR